MLTQYSKFLIVFFPTQKCLPAWFVWLACLGGLGCLGGWIGFFLAFSSLVTYVWWWFGVLILCGLWCFCFLCGVGALGGLGFLGCFALGTLVAWISCAALVYWVLGWLGFLGKLGFLGWVALFLWKLCAFGGSGFLDYFCGFWTLITFLVLLELQLRLLGWMACFFGNSESQKQVETNSKGTQRVTRGGCKRELWHPGRHVGLWKRPGDPCLNGCQALPHCPRNALTPV